MSTIPGMIFNHPDALRAYGVPFLPNQFRGTGSGRVFWVGNRSGLPSSNGSNPDYPFSSVNAAAAACVSGRGDIIYVLPGHAESISAANGWSNLVAGTKVIGLGTGIDRPRFTWTASAGTIAVAVANVRIENCMFFAAGATGSTTALTVTVGFPITAAGFQFVENFVNCGVDSDQLCTDLFTLSAAADDNLFQGNRIIGQAGSVITSIITTTGAVDRLVIRDNIINADGGTAQIIDLSNAAIIQNDILNNIIVNTVASSTGVIKPHATSTGYVHGNIWGSQDGSTAPAVSGWTTFTTTYQFGINQAITTTAKSALLCPAVDA